jgi:hypothetical protein
MPDSDDADTPPWKRALEESVVLSTLRRVSRDDTDSVGGPHSGRPLTGYREWVTESVAYRWLTTDAEFGTVVVNLRQTRLLGPLLAAGARLADRVSPWWNNSQARAATDLLGRRVERLAETRGGRLVVTLLTPPRSGADRSRTEAVDAARPDDSRATAEAPDERGRRPSHPDQTSDGER